MSRIPLAVIRERPGLVECTSCGQCCTYVGVAVHPPSRVRWATDILWYPYRENVGWLREAKPGVWRVARKARIDR